MSKKQVRFSSKTAIINDKSNDKPMNPEVNSGKNAAEIEKLQSDEEVVDSMWEKLVLYYLSRLKGLCDWRSYTFTTHEDLYNCKSRQSLESSFSDHLEDQIVKQVTEEALQDTKPNYKRNLTDVSTYMAAGYEEGKQQAAKIVIRSLKFGLLTGILKKDRSVFRIRTKYLGNWKQQKLSHSKLKKKSYTHKQRYSKYTRDKKNHMTLRNGKKCYKNLSRKKKNKARSSLIDGKECSEEREYIKKFFRSLSPLLHSSRSSSPKSIRSRSRDSARAKPSAKRKHSRVVIKKPVIPRPSGKRRGRSQTKSPTPSKSRSKPSVHKYKPRRLKYNRFQTPEPRRCGSVLSSMSSEMSICTLCKRKRDRSNSNDSTTSSNVKKSKGSSRMYYK